MCNSEKNSFKNEISLRKYSMIKSSLEHLVQD